MNQRNGRVVECAPKLRAAAGPELRGTSQRRTTTLGALGDGGAVRRAVVDDGDVKAPQLFEQRVELRHVVIDRHDDVDVTEFELALESWLHEALLDERAGEALLTVAHDVSTSPALGDCA